MFQLIGLRNQNAPFQLSLNAVTLIGRGESCHLKLDDPSVSRVHCRVVAHHGEVMLYDAGSRWGTFVNGKRVSECNLKPGDCIKVGESTFQVIEASNIAGPVFAQQLEHLELRSLSGNRFPEISTALMTPYTIPNSE